MFCTWKYDPETDEVQNIRKAWDPITARSSQHQACNRCHEKKLKCTGDRNGCDRCISSKLTCEYSRSGQRASRRRQNSGQSTLDSGINTPSSSRGRDGTRSPSSQASSQISRSSTTTTKDRRSSKAVRRASASPRSDVSHVPIPHRHAPNLSPNHSHEQESALSHLNISPLGPNDGFDIALLNASVSSADEYAATTCSDYSSTTSPEYTAVSTAYFPTQQAYADHYDGWSAAPAYPSHPATCGALGTSYLDATNLPAFSTLPAETFQEYSAYGNYHRPDPRHWSHSR